MKIVVIGEAGVGKTSLIRRLTKDQFDPTYLLTIGMDPTAMKFTIESEPGKTRVIEAAFWDIAGQEQFRVIRDIFYRGAEAAVAVFDLTRRDTMTKLNNWINEFFKIVGQKPLLILGNKSDMEDLISLGNNEIKEFVSKYKPINYYAVSAKTGGMVKDSLHELVQFIVNKK